MKNKEKWKFSEPYDSFLIIYIIKSREPRDEWVERRKAITFFGTEKNGVFKDPIKTEARVLDL